ncbi:MAG: HdeD family acid-resistance protein [Synechococcaceae cyanobacterium SM1_2_3]|nr:HdeD family acid-resistance protein [Synechococcaceae cyanobacterium SM1_2_3]
MTDLTSPPLLDSDAAIQNALKSHTTAFLGSGILFLVVGTVAILLPVFGTFLAETLLGGMMILSGFLYCGLSFQLRGFWNVVWMLIAGLLTIAAGLVLWLYPSQSILTLTLLLSAYFIVTGVFKAIHALQHRAINGWFWSLVSAITSILLGGIVWWGFPGTALWTLGLLFGIDLVFYGWTLIAIRAAVTANPVSVSSSFTPL